jgi:hypothetical protein
MSRLLRLPNELLMDISSGLVTEHLHSLVLTNRVLHLLLENRLYEAPSEVALTRVIDTGNVAVFQRFLECGLDVNVVVARHSRMYRDIRIPLLAYVVSEVNPGTVMMAQLMFKTGKIDTTGWGIWSDPEWKRHPGRKLMTDL